MPEPIPPPCPASPLPTRMAADTRRQQAARPAAARIRPSRSRPRILRQAEHSVRPRRSPRKASPLQRFFAFPSPTKRIRSSPAKFPTVRDTGPGQLAASAARAPFRAHLRHISPMPFSSRHDTTVGGAAGQSPCAFAVPFPLRHSSLSRCGHLPTGAVAGPHPMFRPIKGNARYSRSAFSGPGRAGGA